MENDLNYKDLQRRYKQLAEAMGVNADMVEHDNLLNVALILNKIKTAISHDRYKDTGVYFITGEMGEKDDVGLPEQILICPTHGLAGFAVYKKVKNYTEPGY